MSRSKLQTYTPKTSLPVREKVYNYLKSAILSGNFDPGERLTEEHLATKMKVSRTPVRETLHKLESEGLIKLRKKRRGVVSKDSKRKWKKVLNSVPFWKDMPCESSQKPFRKKTFVDLKGLFKMPKSIKKN